MEQDEITDLVAELQAKVAERRASGDYPPGMEDELEAEFERLVGAVRRGELDTGNLAALVEALAASASAVRADASLGSRVPGGRLLHSTAARTIRRHTTPLADSVRAVAEQMTAVARELTRLVEAQRSADERQMLELLAALVDRVAVIDHVAHSLVDLERRVAALERPDASEP